jgi:trimeric autotransporter adhesin
MTYKKIILIFLTIFLTKNVKSQSFIDLPIDGIITAIYSNSSSDDVYISCLTYNTTNGKETIIYKWDGSNLNEIGSDIIGEIRAMIIYDGNLVIAGSFQNIDDGSFNNIAIRSGNSWLNLNDGLGNKYSIIYSLCLFNDTLFAGGNLSDNGSNLFYWNNTIWKQYNYFNGPIFCICPFRNELYVSGDFTRVDTTQIKYLAKYSSFVWQSLADSLDGKINKMIVRDNKLYLSGAFYIDQESPFSFIGYFDGNEFHSLGSGVNSYVSDMSFIGSNLYVSGGFDSSGAEPTNKISQWDGENWEPVSLNNLEGSVLETYGIGKSGASLLIFGKFVDVNNNRKRIILLNP